MNAPVVSVIVPCFRQAQFLGAAIQSVQAQSYGALEIIVVNDGSDDNTDEVVAKLGAAVRYIRSPNRGVSAARNLGIARAQGKYLLFLDADDLLHPEAIRWLVDAAGGRDDCMTVVGFRKFIKTAKDSVGKDSFPPQEGLPFPVLIHTNLGPPNCFLVPNSAVRQIGGFNTSLTHCEDWEMWTRLGIRGLHIVVVPQIGAYYRQSPFSMSRNRLRMLSCRAHVLLGMHRAWIDDAAALVRFGQDLAAAELRVLRRCLAWKHTERRVVDDLKWALCELESRGYGVSGSRMKQLLRRFVGMYTEDCAIHLLRWTDRTTIESLQRDIL